MELQGLVPPRRSASTPSSDQIPTIEPTKQPPTPAQPLSTIGPWLLIGMVSEGGLSFWALNPDGTGLTELVGGEDAASGISLSMSVGPTGGRVAYVDETGLDIPRLRMMSLPNPGVTTITGLLPPDFAWPPLDRDHAEQYEAAMQTYAAATRNAGLWSNDGRRLAFVGAIDGPSSDLYLYNSTTGEITRLTDGPTEAVLPVGYRDLRTVDIETGRVNSVWPRGYALREYDPKSQTVLFYEPIPDNETSCSMFLLSVPDGAPRLVDSVEPRCSSNTVTWSEGAGVFFVDTESGVVPLTPSGEILEVSVPLKFFPKVSSQGLWALSDEGLRIGTPEEGFREVVDWKATTVWRPNGEALVLVRWHEDSDELFDLYDAQSPDFASQLIARDLRLGWAVTWIQP